MAYDTLHLCSFVAPGQKSRHLSFSVFSYNITLTQGSSLVDKTKCKEFWRMKGLNMPQEVLVRVCWCNIYIEQAGSKCNMHHLRLHLISFGVSTEFGLVSIKYCLCYERIKTSPWMKETLTLLKSETKLLLRDRISSHMLRIFQRHLRICKAPVRFQCKKSSEVMWLPLLIDLPIRNLPTFIVNLGLGFYRLLLSFL